MYEHLPRPTELSHLYATDEFHVSSIVYYINFIYPIKLVCGGLFSWKLMAYADSLVTELVTHRWKFCYCCIDL